MPDYCTPNTWLADQDSNLEPPDPKSGVLPIELSANSRQEPSENTSRASVAVRIQQLEAPLATWLAQLFRSGSEDLIAAGIEVRPNPIPDLAKKLRAPKLDPAKGQRRIPLDVGAGKENGVLRFR